MSPENDPLLRNHHLQQALQRIDAHSSDFANITSKLTQQGTTSSKQAAPDGPLYSRRAVITEPLGRLVLDAIYQKHGLEGIKAFAKWAIHPGTGFHPQSTSIRKLPEEIAPTIDGVIKEQNVEIQEVDDQLKAADAKIVQEAKDFIMRRRLVLAAATLPLAVTAHLMARDRLQAIEPISGREELKILLALCVCGALSVCATEELIPGSSVYDKKFWENKRIVTGQRRKHRNPQPDDPDHLFMQAPATYHPASCTPIDVDEATLAAANVLEDLIYPERARKAPSFYR